MLEFFDHPWEIGTLKNTHHVEIKGNVNPVVTPVRKIPFALKSKLEMELGYYWICPKTNRLG